MFKPILSSPTFEQQSIVRNVEISAIGSAMVMEHSVEQKTLAGAGEPWSRAFESSVEQKTLAGAGEPWSSLEVSVEQKTLASAGEPGVMFARTSAQGVHSQAANGIGALVAFVIPVPLHVICVC